jgi:DNA-binding NarL/FixJ family response regulator
MQRSTIRLPHDSTVRDVVYLSAREQAILGLVEEGMSNRDIADSQDIAECTVKTYLSGMFQGFGLHNRTQLAGFSLAHPDLKTKGTAEIMTHATACVCRCCRAKAA